MGPIAGGKDVGDQTSREWTDRRCADGQVPDKVRHVVGWKRALRDFMSKDPRLNDLTGLFSQKFLAMGVNKNFTMSTLSDLSWKVLVLTWEAVLEEKLPLGDEVETGFKDKYLTCKSQLQDARMTYLEELSRFRDEKRKAAYGMDMWQAIQEINSMDDDEIFRFQPEKALEEEVLPYFRETLKENMKLMLTRGAAAAGEQTQMLAKQLLEKDQIIEDLRDQLATANKRIQRLLEELEEKGRRKSLAPTGDSDKLKEELNQLTVEKEAAQAQAFKYRGTLVHPNLGYDVDNMSDADFASPTLPPKALEEIGRLKEQRDNARNMHKAEVKKVADLEDQLKEAKRQLEALSGGLNAKQGAIFQQQIDKLNKELATLKAELEAAKRQAESSAAEAAALKAEKADLEKNIAALQAQLVNSGGPDAATLEELRKAKAALEAKEAELQAAREGMAGSGADAERRAAEAQKRLEEERACLAKARAEIEDLRAKLKAAMSNQGVGQTSDAEVEELKAKIAELEAKIAELEQRIADLEGAVKLLKSRNKTLSDKLAETKAQKEALEEHIETMKKKMLEMKAKLAEYGVDTTIFDKVLEETGLASLAKPGRVFDRLYYDALKRRDPEVRAKVVAERERRRDVRGALAAAATAIRLGHRPEEMKQELMRQAAADATGTGDDDELDTSLEPQAQEGTGSRRLSIDGVRAASKISHLFSQQTSPTVCPHCGFAFDGRRSSLAIDLVDGGESSRNASPLRHGDGSPSASTALAGLVRGMRRGSDHGQLAADGGAPESSPKGAPANASNLLSGSVGKLRAQQSPSPSPDPKEKGQGNMGMMALSMARGRAAALRRDRASRSTDSPRRDETPTPRGHEGKPQGKSSHHFGGVSVLDGGGVSGLGGGGSRMSNDADFAAGAAGRPATRGPSQGAWLAVAAARARSTARSASARREESTSVRPAAARPGRAESRHWPSPTAAAGGQTPLASLMTGGERATDVSPPEGISGSAPAGSSRRALAIGGAARPINSAPAGDVGVHKGRPSASPPPRPGTSAEASSRDASPVAALLVQQAAASGAAAPFGQDAALAAPVVQPSGGMLARGRPGAGAGPPGGLGALGMISGQGMMEGSAAPGQRRSPRRLLGASGEPRLRPAALLPAVISGEGISPSAPGDEDAEAQPPVAQSGGSQPNAMQRASPSRLRSQSPPQHISGAGHPQGGQGLPYAGGIGYYHRGGSQPTIVGISPSHTAAERGERSAVRTSVYEWTEEEQGRKVVHVHRGSPRHASPSNALSAALRKSALPSPPTAGEGAGVLLPAGSRPPTREEVLRQASEVAGGDAGGVLWLPKSRSGQRHSSRGQGAHLAPLISAAQAADDSRPLKVVMLDSPKPAGAASVQKSQSAPSLAGALSKVRPPGSSRGMKPAQRRELIPTVEGIVGTMARSSTPAKNAGRL